MPSQNINPRVLFFDDNRLVHRESKIRIKRFIDIAAGLPRSSISFSLSNIYEKAQQAKKIRLKKIVLLIYEW
jgi:hypothetical protein